MFSAKSPFTATVLGGVDVYMCVCVCVYSTCKGLNARHICQCVFDFANVWCMCAHCMSICNTQRLVTFTCCTTLLWMP